MNQGRIWCVVNPTVGLPLLLGSVAITSLIVHASVMTNVPWMAAYWSGSWRNRAVTGAPLASNEGAAAVVADAAVRGAPGLSVTVTPVPAVPGRSGTSFVVSVSAEPGAVAAADAAGAAAPRAPGPLAMSSPPPAE